MKTIYLTVLLLTMALNASSQKAAYGKAPTAYSSVIDTVSVGKYSVELKVLWKNDTIIIRKYCEPSVVDTGFFRILHKDKNYIPDAQEIKKNNDFFATSAQNCHSYALEQYFLSNHIPNAGIFNKETTIFPESYQKILETSFEKVQEFNVVKRKKIQPDIPFRDNSLLVFYSQNDLIIHSVYYKNKVFYSKNGAFKAVADTKITNLLALYRDTKYIKVYTLKKEADNQ